MPSRSSRTLGAAYNDRPPEKRSHFYNKANRELLRADTQLQKMEHDPDMHDRLYVAGNERVDHVYDYVPRGHHPVYLGDYNQSATAAISGLLLYTHADTYRRKMFGTCDEDPDDYLFQIVPCWKAPRAMVDKVGELQELFGDEMDSRVQFLPAILMMSSRKTPVNLVAQTSVLRLPQADHSHLDHRDLQQHSSQPVLPMATTPSLLAAPAPTPQQPPSAADTFAFPAPHSFPPFFTLQPNTQTLLSQLQKWSALIQSYCRHHRLYRLSLVDALDSALFHNRTIRRRLSLADARKVLDWMCSAEGGRRAEWVGGEAGGKSAAWIWWRRPEEWAGVIADWVEETAQKNTVLTLYELIEGEATISQEFHGMDPDVLQKSLHTLVKRGKAQVFGSEDQQGVKFF
ncbi:conserved hypothetical protein [Uncinocarpus reesii 1704]|uniref:Vacuolar protein-sorting-associated protein 25 n=1 Tax=Uncinocarpus reesii (strain UAMH 1704) TaxID=336963 RepID=C4JTL9_UNCRE|nr:uncharacterized protein UREG_05808 [Uncinocarpus reesii 1704]EEP80966.1 conserved hypothetical protein [Uncinocarpus reesii 1704]